MPGWKKKLGLDFPVARQTEVGLLGLEQLRERGVCVYSMAIIAAHGSQLVGPSLKLEEFLLLLVAFQASVRSNLGFLVPERENQLLLSARIDVLFTRPVAGLATFSSGERLGVRVKRTMRILLLKCPVEVAMTSLADSGRESFYVALRRQFLGFLNERGTAKYEKDP